MSPYIYEQKRITYPDGSWADVSLARFPADALYFTDIVLRDFHVRMRDAARFRYYKARIRGEQHPIGIAWACLEEDRPAPHMFPTLNTTTDDGEHLLSTNTLVTYTLRELLRRGWLRWQDDTWRTEIPPGYPRWQERADTILGWLMAEERLWLEVGPDELLPSQTAFEDCDPLLHLTAVGRCGYIRDVVRQQMPRIAFNTGFFLLEHDDYISHHSALGDPYGMQVHDGDIIRPPLYHRGTIWQTADGQWAVGRIGMDDVRLILPGGMTLYPLNDPSGNEPQFVVNPPPDEDVPAAIYTRYSGVRTQGQALGHTPHAPGRFELTVIDRAITGWKRGGGLLIPQNGFVLSFAASSDGQPLREIGSLAPNIEALRELLRGGSLRYTFARPEHQGIRRALQCGPLLIQDGQSVLSAATFDKEEYWISRMGEDRYLFGIVPTEYPCDTNRTRAARIGLGIDADGNLIVLAISGSSKGIAREGIDSVGATLDELTEQLLAAGAVAAVNLDGGGSTQLFVEGGLYNSPGDRRGRQGVTYERLVPTIGVVP